MFHLAFLSCVALVTGYIAPELHHAQPFKFGYTIKDHHGEQHRAEAGDGAGNVVGNYGFTDDRGIARQVNYVADHAGFRAQVKTNEPGTAGQSPAAVQMISNDPYVQGAAVPYVSRPNSPVVPALGQADPVLGLGYGHAGLHGLGYGHAGVHGLGYAHAGAHGLGYGQAGLGHANGVYGLEYGVPGIEYGVHGLGYGAHGLGYEAHGLGYGANGLLYGAPGIGYEKYGYGGALGYSGLLGTYGGIVNYGAPLVGGAIRGYDSRFVNLP